MVSLADRPAGGPWPEAPEPRRTPAFQANGSIARQSPSARAIVLPQLTESPTGAVQPEARRTTWASLLRQPGIPWRTNPPTGPAMPVRWCGEVAPAKAAPALDAGMPVDFRFGELSISAPVLRSVWDAGYRQPTPIQALTIPHMLAGKDCVGQAHTGTGKTAAFGIPIVERVDLDRNVVQALILVPTRELCRQVTAELQRLAAHRGDGRLQVLAVYGGEGMDRQLRALAGGVHVVVGTPGRVQDHIWRGTLKLDHVRTAVLDEADEMLDIGFADAIEAILRCVPKERQTALFSATIPPFVHRLVRRYLVDPEWFNTVTGTDATDRIPAQIRQSYVEVAERDKLEAFEELVRSEPGYTRVLVFRRMKIMSDRLAQQMQRKGYSARALHGDLPQGERNRVLEDFRNGNIRFLVATNVAARGLDIPEVTHVLNYDLPETPEEYTHRIGRTGRAGRAGTAISFVGEWDFEAFAAIKERVGDALKERPLALYAPK